MPRIKETEKQLAQVETALRAAVLDLGMTLESEHVTVSLMQGRTVWNTKALERHFADKPELLNAFRSTGDTFTTIRWKGK